MFKFFNTNNSPRQATDGTTLTDFTGRPKATPERIDKLLDDEIFVFGSNIAGQHNGGAAAAAAAKFGAVQGIGAGPQGQSYAIPTVGIHTEAIEHYVDQFTAYAQANPALYFYVTRIGCGHGGFTDKDIAPMFATAASLPNVCLPAEFQAVLGAKKKTNANGRTQIYNVVILDRSGSMSSMRKAAIDGFNETLAAINQAAKKHAKTQEHNVTLVTFCSCRLDKVYSTVPADQAKPLTKADYQPCCCTPLYDAMGATLTAMRKRVAQEDDAMVVVTIITDGYENDSHEYSGADIKKLVGELRDEGWTFSYLGANQDAVEVATSLNIRNASNFEATEEGLRGGYGSQIRYRRTVYDRMAEMAPEEPGMTREQRRKARAKIADEAFDELENEDK